MLVEEDDDGVAIEGEKVVIESGNEEEEEDYGGGWDGEEDLIVMDDDGDGCEKVAPRAHPSSRPPFSPSKRVMSSPPQEQRSPLASVRGVRSSLSSFSPIPMFAASRAPAPGRPPSSPGRPAGGHDDYSWMDRLPHYTPISVLERSAAGAGTQFTCSTSSSSLTRGERRATERRRGRFRAGADSREGKGRKGKEGEALRREGTARRWTRQQLRITQRPPSLCDREPGAHGRQGLHSLRQDEEGQGCCGEKEGEKVTQPCCAVRVFFLFVFEYCKYNCSENQGPGQGFGSHRPDPFVFARL